MAARFSRILYFFPFRGIQIRNAIGIALGHTAPDHLQGGIEQVILLGKSFLQHAYGCREPALREMACKLAALPVSVDLLFKQREDGGQPLVAAGGEPAMLHP